MSFTFSVLAGVSSDEQVYDKNADTPDKRRKASMEDQERVARAHGEREGGEYVKTYFIDGYSRTGYWDLTTAMLEIKELKRCLDDAYSYDVLIVKNYDRLGDLREMVYNYLGQKKIQFIAAELPTPIVPREKYNYLRSPARSMIAAAGLPQAYRITKILDNLSIGNRRRAEDGLYTVGIPYGYTKVDKKTVIVNETVAPHLVRFKESFLEGKSLAEICRRAAAAGIPAPAGGAWNNKTIAYILRNPFYAGKTFFEKGRYEEKTYRLKPTAELTLYDGQHPSLWSYDDYLRILAEFERRHRVRSLPMDYNLSGILKCSECGKSLHITYGGTRDNPRWVYWICKGHVSIPVASVNKQVGDEILRLYEGRGGELDADTIKSTGRKELAQAEKRLERLDAENELGAYTPEEFTEKRKVLRALIATLRDEERHELETRRRMEETQKARRDIELILPDIHGWLWVENPSVAKFQLSRAFHFTAFPDKTVRVDFNQPS